MKILRYLVLAGDVVYIFWILYNGIDEGLRGITSIQGVVPLGLMLLLALNLILLGRSK